MPPDGAPVARQWDRHYGVPGSSFYCRHIFVWENIREEDYLKGGNIQQISIERTQVRHSNTKFGGNTNSTFAGNFARQMPFKPSGYQKTPQHVLLC